MHFKANNQTSGLSKEELEYQMDKMNCPFEKTERRRLAIATFNLYEYIARRKASEYVRGIDED